MAGDQFAGELVGLAAGRAVADRDQLGAVLLADGTSDPARARVLAGRLVAGRGDERVVRGVRHLRTAEPERARALFGTLLRLAQAAHPHVACGEFAAEMQVSLTNEGPVTFWLQS